MHRLPTRSTMTTAKTTLGRPAAAVASAPGRARAHPRRATGPARAVQLLIGLGAVGTGIGLLIRSGLGVASWDVLNVGLSAHLGLSVGQVALLSGLLAALLASVIGERPRLTSLVPLLIVGPAIDATMALVGPAADAVGQATLLLAGLLTLATGVGAYIATGSGAAPSDLVFLGIARRGLPVWASRLLVDGAVVLLGWALGGPVGVGTVIVTLLLGPLIGQMLRAFDLTDSQEARTRDEQRHAHHVASELAWELDDRPRG